MAKEQEQIEKYVKLLGCSVDEAKDIIEKDKIIDKGGRTEFDLTPEQEKMAKKFANVKTKKTVYNFDNRGKARKENPTKAGIIKELSEFLEKISEYACENVEITNKERQIAFKIGENAYELTLVQKRKPKK